jgi:ribosome biogenesis GTPase
MNSNLIMQTGRIIEAHRTNFTVALEAAVVTGTVRGSFHVDGDFPKVGDYVNLSLLGDDQAVIEEVLPRTSVIKRKTADGEGEQIIVANADLIFIVMGLDGDFNLSRLERYLLLAKQSEVAAVIVLNKADVVENPLEYVAQVQVIAGAVPVHAVSALTGDGLPAVTRHITPTTTAVLLGSSGAGKSTITNWLLSEERQAVKATRESDNRGRHTTTSRQLFALPKGGFLIDTPGMRELAVLESKAEDEQAVFERIEQFSNQCKFSNCDHEKSVGCAVLAAVESGELSQRELKNYRKLVQERQNSSNKEITTGARLFLEYQQRAQQRNNIAAKRKRS